MAYYQKVPQPNKLLSFTENNFAGGLNNRSTQLLPGQSSDVMNMKFDDETLMSRREGIGEYDATTLPSAITWMDEFRPYTDPSVFLRASDSELYAGTTKIADLSGIIAGTNYMGKYVFVDGVKIRFYGKFPQTAPDAHTVLVGTVNPNNVVMQLITPAAGFTPLPAPNITGVWKYNYTTLQFWYEPCAAEVADTYKGGNVVPDGVKYLAVHGDRLFLSGATTDKSNVYISDISNGLYFPVFLPMQLPPNGDVITGLAVFSDSVVIGRKNDIHVIYGNTNRTNLDGQLFRLKKVNTHTGFASQNSVDVVNNYLFFLGYDGNIYSMITTKTDVDNLATSIVSKDVDLLKAPVSGTSADLANARSIFHKDEWYLCVGDKVMVYSYRHRAFTMFKFAGGVKVTSFYVKDFQFIMGSSLGKLLKFTPDVYSDLGKPYQAYWYSRILDMGDPSTFKSFREFYVTAHMYAVPSTVNFKFEIDYVDSDGSEKVYNANSVWGRSIWGDRFINRNIITSIPIVIGRRGRTLRIKLYNGYFQTDTVADKAALDAYLNDKEGMLIYVTSEAKYYLFTNLEWVKQEDSDLYQPMKVYEVSGQFEFRGKR